ncbi:MAG: hypothetical protein PHX87_01540 [Candidatus Peribacteraceae bacterium]|nr:hypothetical protein [Candidatus Peribacteraceae bacterium]MDD5742090.1 hypothetical protein [Candidatus Peribacteraceae bacterium]
MSFESFHPENAAARKEAPKIGPVESQDPEKNLQPEDLKAMREEIAGRPEMPLPQYLRAFHDQAEKCMHRICIRLNDLTKFRQSPGWEQSEVATYEQLEKQLQAMQDTADKIEGEGRNTWRFTDTMNLMRGSEKLIADLDALVVKLEQQFLPENQQNWLTYERWHRDYGMNAMLSDGLGTELMKDGKHPEIQSLAVPDNVTVSILEGDVSVDFQKVADVRDTEGENATASNIYARKISQFRKLIHLKIPKGKIPKLRFDWTDTSTGRAMESTVTGRKNPNGTWLFCPALPDEAPVAPAQAEVQEQTPARRRRFFRR